MCSLLTIPPPSSPSLLVFQAVGGRLGATMTAYIMLLVLRWEYNVSVLVDRATMVYLDQAFDIQVMQNKRIICINQRFTVFFRTHCLFLKTPCAYQS